MAIMAIMASTRNARAMVHAVARIRNETNPSMDCHALVDCTSTRMVLLSSSFDIQIQIQIQIAEIRESQIEMHYRNEAKARRKENGKKIKEKR